MNDLNDLQYLMISNHITITTNNQIPILQYQKCWFWMEHDQITTIR